MSKALDIKNLKVAFPSPRGMIKAVEGIDLSVEEGECVALVGESGCGKSVTSLASLKLLDTSAALVRTDRHILCGEDVSEYSESRMQKVRGSLVSMVFQDALTALNPVMTVGKQLDEVFRRHTDLDKKEIKKRSVEALSMVGIPDPEKRYSSYPHELSGGMRQRVLIAMAFACRPRLIIADEPTTALDVTIQAQILELLKKLQTENGTALLLISHDLSVVAHMADRINVMYSGKIVESASAAELIKRPLHPYTKGLMSAVTQMGDSGRFVQIPGTLPDPTDKPSGCCFCPRCSIAEDVCAVSMPKLIETGPGRFVRCHLAGGNYE